MRSKAHSLDAQLRASYKKVRLEHPEYDLDRVYLEGMRSLVTELEKPGHGFSEMARRRHLCSARKLLRLQEIYQEP
jgi:hypothetical protein